MMRKVELLAPAGSYESFLGAIHAGADAVYIGGQKYGARAYAENFTEEEICLAIRYAHLLGKKVYLTVNTLVKENELKELPAYITPFYEEGLDGVIVQDFGVFRLLKRLFPNMELHGSTQMTVTGEFGARFLLEQGASRVVPARELSLEEIRQIKATGIEVEAFIHGAMCYCYSGQCLFSSILGGRSGNRGRCAQPCRLPYRVDGDKESYPLSLKDMCTLQMIPRLIEAGIDSFKIEGRMKRPEYAAGVTALYRKYIDMYYANPEKPFVVSKKDMDVLRALYIRSDIQEGYYDKHNGKEMITPQKPSYNKTDESILADIRSKYLEKEKKLPIDGEIVVKVGEPITLTVRLHEAEEEICVKGMVVQAAQKQPLDLEAIEKQICKLGNTNFEMNSLKIDLDNNCFMPVKALNDLRRDAVEQLEEELLKKYRRTIQWEKSEDISTYDEPEPLGVSKTLDENNQYLAVEIKLPKQLSTVLKADAVDRLYLDTDWLEGGLDKKLLDWLNDKKDRTLWLAMPNIIRLRDKEYLRRLQKVILSEQYSCFSGVLVRNLESIQWLKEIGWKKRILADANLYVWNSEAKAFFEELNVAVCAPQENNKKEWNRLGIAQMEILAYGRATLMVTANCIQKTCRTCMQNKNTDQATFLSLTDRYHISFPVRNVCKHCYNEIYNSLPTSLHENIDFLKQAFVGGIRLTFTNEQEQEIKEVIACYDNCFKGAKEGELQNISYTKGHYKRGVE